MKKESQTNLIFYTLYRRPAHGCLPLFVLVALALIGGILCLVKVKMPTPLRPKGVGVVQIDTNETTAFDVECRSIYPLLQRIAAAPPADDTELPVCRSKQPSEPPPVSLFPQVPDSAVLDAEELLKLPPAAEEEVSR